MEKKAALDIKPITQLSAFISNESERKGWTEEKYKRKNNDKEKNNHYDWSRRKLDFEVTKNGKIKELGSNPVSLYERLKIRLGELGFTPYKSNSPNVPRICANIVVSGNSEQLRKLAFGQQKVDYSDEGMGKNGDVKRMPGIEKFAVDVYNFACREFGEENVMCCNVHLDETTPHIHLTVIPTAMQKKKAG